MIGKNVQCLVNSAFEKRLISGKIVKQCDNHNVYVLRLSHDVDFAGFKEYTYSKGDTMLVSLSEILT